MCDSRYKKVKTVLCAILFANFVVAIIKVLIGITCGSYSVTADGIHSFADGASNIVGLIGIWLASKPRDEKHPYGHGKYEIIASLFIGAMLALMSVQIISLAIASFRGTRLLEFNLSEGLLLFLTIIVNSAVAFTEYHRGKKLGSTILVTDSLHTRGDILISCAVLFGLICINLGIPLWVDGLLSISVAIAVLISAAMIIKDCTDILVDSAVVDSDEVKQLLIAIPGVYNVHGIRSRGVASHIFIDLHVIVSPEVKAVYMHTLSHSLEKVLKEHFGANTEANIHLEPNDGRHTE